MLIVFTIQDYIIQIEYDTLPFGWICWIDKACPSFHFIPQHITLGPIYYPCAFIFAVHSRISSQIWIKYTSICFWMCFDTYHGTDGMNRAPSGRINLSRQFIIQTLSYSFTPSFSNLFLIIYQLISFNLNFKSILTLTVLPIPFPETIIDSPLFAKDSLDIVILATLASFKSLVSTEFVDL